ncbi:hypothetical protein HK099_002426 [Clydaea vesicula]|uniref:Fibronectin type-III domain-containing protein n=1 Tax=Clydaea vesicula TaxID=447962 RepID=A0AAD5U8L5_9FUNG|nr:hypothetical protein HK099_002426 [Clydaea vesicula]
MLRDMKEMEMEFNDAPRIIKGLREEATALKLKEYFGHLTSDTRQLRGLNKEVRNLKEQNYHYQQLINEKGLDEREVLKRDLDESKLNLERQIKFTSELQHRTDLIEKNLNLENKNFRIKIKNIKEENYVYKNKTDNLENLLKEKDKEIASLSIYRFKAVHNKSSKDQICKVCDKREKDEQEKQKLKLLIDRLPKVNLKPLENQSPTEIELILNFDFKPLINFEWDAIFVRCFEDSKNIKLLKEFKLNYKEFVNSSEVKEAINFSNTSNSQQTMTKVNVKFSNLKNGAYYYFDCFSAFQGVRGEAFKIESGILADILPEKPNKPSVSIKIRNEAPEIELLIDSVLSRIGESKIRKYHVYHSNFPDMSDKFLIAEIPSDTFDPEEEVTVDDREKTLFSETKNEVDSNVVSENILTMETEIIEDHGNEEQDIKNPLSANALIESDNNSHDSFKEKNDVIETSAESTSVNCEVDCGEKNLILAVKDTAEYKVDINAINMMLPQEKKSCETSKVKFCYTDPTLLTEHYFSVTAINGSGEGPHSDTTDCIKIDVKPNTPSKPIVERISTHCVKISCTVEKNLGSEVTSYKLKLFKSQKKGYNSNDLNISNKSKKKEIIVEKKTNTEIYEEEEKIKENNLIEEEILIAVRGNEKKFQEHYSGNNVDDFNMEEKGSSENVNFISCTKFTYVLDNLNLGYNFKVKVLAMNDYGFSDESYFSDEIDLEHMIPTPKILPNFKIISTTSVLFEFRDNLKICENNLQLSNLQKADEESPFNSHVIGRKIYSSFEHDMHGAVVEVPFIDLKEKFLCLENLNKAQQYYFAFSYISETKSEGSLSNSMFIPLAAAIQLPPSPIERLTSNLSGTEDKPTSATSNQLSQQHPLVHSQRQSLSLLGNKARTSKYLNEISTSNLSLNQKLVNMHNGYPAHSEINLSQDHSNSDDSNIQGHLPPDSVVNPSQQTVISHEPHGNAAKDSSSNVAISPKEKKSVGNSSNLGRHASRISNISVSRTLKKK